mmetsp:Transcript_43106/g.78380  ORF Transcript_43106/g.78380 Transcript_43106/m.78380 type:complete len:246 (-) Transcript_43106:150-887(-)
MATVTFDVGGTIKKVLEQVVRSKPDTLLCTLLDDPARKSEETAIFVDRSADLFDLVMDWYRHGYVLLPPGVGMERMKLECAYYALPDDVEIRQECVADLLHSFRDWRKGMVQKATTELSKAAEAYSKATQSLVVAAAFHGLVESADGVSLASIESGFKATYPVKVKCKTPPDGVEVFHKFDYSDHFFAVKRDFKKEDILDWWKQVRQLLKERCKEVELDADFSHRECHNEYTVRPLKRKREEMEG